jgi:YbbR domain-containing protein
MQTRSLLLENIGLKVIALLLGGLIWAVASGERRERPKERPLEVPLVLAGFPSDLVITNAFPQTVNVRLRGRDSTLRSLSSQNVEATLDLSGSARPGEVSFALRPDVLNLPARVEVVSINPPSVTFRLERRQQKAIPIRPYLVGSLPLGFEAGEVTVTPPQALVSGPASLIRDISEVATDRIILSGRISPFVVRVGLVSDSALIRILEPATAQVAISVERAGSEAPGDEAEAASTIQETDESNQTAVRD